MSSNDNKQELKKSMSARDIWCLALGAMIGFGCFVLPGNSFLPKAGPLGTAVGLLIGALMVMTISISFSYLVRKMPKSGGHFSMLQSFSGNAMLLFSGGF